MRRASLATFGTVTVVLFVTAGYGIVLRFRTPHPPAPNIRVVAAHPSIEAIAANNRAKRAAALRVLHERLPLLAAAELFREVNGSEGLERLRALPGGSGMLRERLCRQVVQYVCVVETGSGMDERPPEWSYCAELCLELECLLAAGVLAEPNP